MGLLESTFLLAGSVDLMTQELVMLDAVLLAESKGHANWSCLASLIEQLPEGDVRTAFQAAVDQVEPQEDEHLGWAEDMRCKMIGLQAKSGAAQAVGAKAEELVARIRELFEHGGERPGRTPMDKPDRPSDEGPRRDDDQPVVPEPVRSRLPDDPEVPEADAIEQAEEVVAGGRVGQPTRNPEVPEADAWEQSIEVPLDEQDEPS